jgi:hypothetical protein
MSDTTTFRERLIGIARGELGPEAPLTLIRSVFVNYGPNLMLQATGINPSDRKALLTARKMIYQLCTPKEAAAAARGRAMGRWQIMHAIIERVTDQTAVSEGVALVRSEGADGLLPVIQGFPGDTAQGRMASVLHVEAVVNARLEGLASHPEHTVDFIGRSPINP